MLKNLKVSFLTLLILAAFSSVYSQNSLVMYAYYVNQMPNARAYAPEYVWDLRETAYLSNSYKTTVYYAPLPSASVDPYNKYMSAGERYAEDEAMPAQAVIITNDRSAISSDENVKVVFYRNYVRPSDRETEAEITWMPQTAPVEMGKTTTYVAPHGYTTYTSKHPSQHPIRDFRASYWLTKYYRDEFHNHASYNETYGAYNYWNNGWNSAAGDESSE